MEDNVNDLPNPDEFDEAYKRERMGQFKHREEADENGNPSISAFDEAADYIRKRMSGAGKPIETLEELLNLTRNARPVDEYQQQVLNAMKTQQTHIMLMFGPGHGQTMTLNGPPADEIVWQEAAAPTFEASTDPLGDIGRRRQGTHMYRLSDELESAQMEECALYVHHERCCERRFERGQATSHYERKPRDVFNKPHLRRRTHGPEDYPSIF